MIREIKKVITNDTQLAPTKRTSDFSTQNKKVGTSDMKLAKKRGPQKSLRSKLFWGEEAQWSERTAGFL